MKLVVKHPGRSPEVKSFVPDRLSDELRETIGGYVEQIRIDKHLMLCCDEEGKLKKRPINIVLPDKGQIRSFIVGTVVIVGLSPNGRYLRGLTSQEITDATLWLIGRSIKWKTPPQ